MVDNLGFGRKNSFLSHGKVLIFTARLKSFIAFCTQSNKMCTSRNASAFIRATALIAAFLLLQHCTNRSADTAATPTVAVADTVENPDDPAFRLNQMGDSATHLGRYPEAIAFFQQSMDSAAARADSFQYYDSKLDLACVHERLSEFQRAIEIGKEVIEAYLRSGDSAHIGRGYATLASFYGSANMQPEFLDAARKGFDIVKTHGSLIERCAAYNQMAFTYSGVGRWADALPLLDSALVLMRASGVVDQIASMYLNLGNCHRNLGHLDEAQRYLFDCARLTDSLGQTHVHAVALLRLSQVAEARGDFAGALELFKQSKTIRDSIFTDEKTRSLQELEVKYQTAEKENKISLLEARHEAEVARRNLVFALLAFSLVITGAWLFRWREKFQQARRELNYHRNQLENFTRLLMQKNARLADLEEQLCVFERQVQQSPIQPGLPAGEGHLSGEVFNRNILTDDDWAAFKEYFERGNPGYILRLRESFPDLTVAEERLFLLLKMNLSSKEAAAMQGISLESIKKNRYRLRKRLGLGERENLEQFIREY